jgi:hypothetical protein
MRPGDRSRRRADTRNGARHRNPVGFDATIANMPGHGGIIFTSGNVPNSGAISSSDRKAHESITCPFCGDKVVGAVVAQTHEQGITFVQWIRCPSCDQGMVKNTGTLFPGPLLGEKVEGLPAEVDAAYLEARRCAGVDAFTSCELMCRKILMHIAVDKGDTGGRTFAQHLDYLENAGLYDTSNETLGRPDTEERESVDT